jgi:L-seryl-tRNA(Ser) seleniumtransferase
MDALLHEASAAPLLLRFGREALKEELRRAISRGHTDSARLIEAAGAALAERFSPSLIRVVNATGVLLHTNLGRAPLPAAARKAIDAVAEGYSSLEFDPEEGGRGKRQDHVRFLARDLFGCEDALAVNNNASAVLLALAALARGREVLVSRGELVAIGGSFQIPEILEASGARLREVGTTNRTTIDDYRRGLGPEVALILSVHPSNYEIRGYVRRPSAAELRALARESGAPWIHDQGTGCVVPLDEFGVPDEATVAQCLADGADLVSFSGDKLFSGPQAGFLVGRGDLVARAAAHPVARAVRPDKLALAALAATLGAWKTGAWREFPIYEAAAAPVEELEARGRRLLEGLPPSGPLTGALAPSLAAFGGGTSPEKLFPSRALALESAAQSADALLALLRAGSPPVVGRVERDRVLLDLRSILPAEDALVAAALAGVAGAR